MPDIHIYGVQDSPTLGILLINLSRLLKGVPYADDLVIVTETEHAVSFRNGERMPFLRVWSSSSCDSSRRNDLIRRLVRLNIDVEDDFNRVFHPKGNYRLGERLYTVEEIEVLEPLT